MSGVMKWRKLGMVFCPSGQADWMQSHAAVPIADHIRANLYKIYYSARDKHNKSFTGFVIVDLKQPDQIIEVSNSPVLVPGNLGEFDDSGAMATWIVKHGGNDFIYYVGWNLGVTVPFRNSIGLATRKSGGQFARYADGPIMDRSMDEPHFCATCCVLPGDDVWRMWYQSCTGWNVHEGKPKHRYHIKYAESQDGIRWRRDGFVAIDYADEREYAIARPSVVHDKDCWRMWYSYRGDSYRIGYAESDDGRRWDRLDHLAGIDVSTVGWDSEMIEYPFVFDHGGERYMLYNGNGYGRTGFGIARLESKIA